MRSGSGGKQRFSGRGAAPKAGHHSLTHSLTYSFQDLNSNSDPDTPSTTTVMASAAESKTVVDDPDVPKGRKAFIPLGELASKLLL